jgi:hypothetical protein
VLASLPSFKQAQITRPKWRPKPRVPFVNGIVVAHTAVAACANWNKVVKRRLATLAFWDVVSTFVVKYTDLVATPSDTTFAFKDVSHVGNPYLFGEGFGDLLFAIWFSGEIAKL